MKFKIRNGYITGEPMVKLLTAIQQGKVVMERTIDDEIVNEFFTDLTGLSRNFVPLAKKIDAYMKKLW